MLLIDLIRSQGLYHPSWAGPTLNPLTTPGIELLADAVLFDVSNVAEYLYAGTNQETWGDDDFPNVAPPFEKFWMEFVRPSTVSSTNPLADQSFAQMPKRIGVLFQAFPDNDGWLLMAAICCTFDDEHAIGPLVVTRYDVAADGSHKSHPASGALAAQPVALATVVARPFTLPLPAGPEREAFLAVLRYGDHETYVGLMKAFYTGVSTWTFAPKLALSFLHCKNVAVQERPGMSTRAERRRLGMTAGTTVRTLDIKPMQRVLRATTGDTGGTLQQALHIVRGHFKEYTADKPLFGKISGRFWWADFVAGTESVGRVEKDYKVFPLEGRR